jgi:hypothetical protein
MDNIIDVLRQTGVELLGRAGGPLHFRLLIQPTVAVAVAIRAGLRDSRAGQSGFLADVIGHPEERSRLVNSAWKDIGKVFLLAMLLDLIYQAVALHAFRPLQTLIVAVTLAVLPYIVIRGPVTRLTRMWARRAA